MSTHDVVLFTLLTLRNSRLINLKRTPKREVSLKEEFQPVLSKKSQILVIDDIISMRKQVIQGLHNQGFTTFIEASNGQKAWEILLNSEQPFDLIVSDWHMPMLSGLELLKKAKNHPEFKDIPFFLVTAENDPALIQMAFDAGVSGYLFKPVSSKSMEEEFQKHFKIKAS